MYFVSYKTSDEGHWRESIEAQKMLENVDPQYNCSSLDCDIQ